MSYLLESLTDTGALAEALAQRAKPGALVLLLGPLGAGKTTLVQALGRALGSSAQISSPTYTLIHEYPAPEGVLVHIDAYRLPSAEALFELGLEDYLERARLVVVEWGDALEPLFPNAFVVRLSLGETSRKAELTQGGKPLNPAR